MNGSMLSRTSMFRRAGRLGVLLLAACLALPATAAKKPKDPPGTRRPPARQTQYIGAGVFKDLDEAQKALDAKDYPKATAALDRVRARQNKLNDYERATLYNLYAAMYYQQNDAPHAIEAYRSVLAQAELPEGLRLSTLFALAQMYIVTEQFPLAVSALDQWFKLAQDPAPEAYVLLAQAYYQQQQYAAAEKALLDALRVAGEKNQPPRENWLGLLRAVYYELGNYEQSAKVLEVLAAQYPSESYYLQLSGMYGLMGRQRAQLATLHAAHLAGMLSKDRDLLNLARLYLVEEAPFAAVRLLREAFDKQRIPADVDNLQLYAQALFLAKEYEAQIPVLRQLAQSSGESRHHMLLGQALVELGQWNEAIDAFDAALKGKDLADPAPVRMQLGTAQFNAGRLHDARRSFILVQDDPKHGQAAANWVKFVGAEIQRRQAIENR